MRTESNTVLPLSSSVPNKGVKSAPTSTDSGAAFGRDFNEAKASRGSAQPAVLGRSQKSAETESKETLDIKSKSVLSHDKGSASVADQVSSSSEKTSETSSVSSSVLSGKVLQSNGDLPPAPDVDRLVEEDVSLLSTDSLAAAASLPTTVSTDETIKQNSSLASEPEVIPGDLINLTEVTLPAVSQEVISVADDSVQLDGLDEIDQAALVEASAVLAVGSGKVSQPNAEADVVSASVFDTQREAEVNKNNSVVNSVESSGAESKVIQTAALSGSLGGMAATASAMNSSLADGSNVTEDSSVAEGSSLVRGSSMAEGSGLLKNSSMTDDSVDPVFVESEDGSQLSWVLSQMDASASKFAAEGAEVVTSLDNSKVGAAAASMFAASLNKNTGPDLVLSSSLNNVDISSEEVVTDYAISEEDVLLDEPIELRKKEQEAMIGRMSAQIDGRVVDDNGTGGLSGSLQNNGVNRLASGINVPTAPMNASQANLAMNLPPSHPGWAGEMSQKVAWVAREGGHTAHIRLDPPELGSLTVKISVDNDSNTQVSFLAATPQARDLLESQMSRLRDMLAQQGMDLSKADVDVSQQDASGTQRQMERDSQNRNNIVSDEAGEELISSNLSYVSASGVDYYA